MEQLIQALNTLNHNINVLSQEILRQTQFRTFPLSERRALVRLVNGIRLCIDPQYLDTAHAYLLDGFWDPILTRYVEHIVTPGMTTVDIGAHIGYHALLARRRSGAQGKLYAFDANPEMKWFFETNFRINGLSRNTTFVSCGLSDVQGTFPFYVLDNYPGSSSLLQSNTEAYSEDGSPHEVQVKVDLLDSALRDVLSVDFIKIDVEGVEANVLRGGAELIRRSPRIAIIAECFEAGLREAIETGGGMIGFARDQGLKIQIINSRTGKLYDIESFDMARDFIPDEGDTQVEFLLSRGHAIPSLF